MSPEQAEVFARQAHHGQLDKFDGLGTPYTEHLARVASDVHGHDAKVVAWLHDVLEDTPTSINDLIKAGVTPLQLAAIGLLTRYKPWDYLDYIRQIVASQNPLAIAVKTADIRDHLRNDGPMIPDSLWRRYREAWEILACVPLASPVREEPAQ